jgi:hypothetical protein
MTETEELTKQQLSGPISAFIDSIQPTQGDGKNSSLSMEELTESIFTGQMDCLSQRGAHKPSHQWATRAIARLAEPELFIPVQR